MRTTRASGCGVWAVSGREAEGRTALANAQQILADYDDYFGYPFPLPKLDSIAIPGGFSGAMENWGAITYTDSALLLSKASSLGDRQDVYSTQAHEMAHQWNGDLVTMGWWDDLWLNESFASWMAAKETDLRNPGWKWWEREDSDKESAMEADARVTSHAIQVHVTDELQAANAFDPDITYNKGQAVLRMLEAYLGPDTFRDGIRRYIKAHAFSNATTADLWNGLSAAERPGRGRARLRLDRAGRVPAGERHLAVRPGRPPHDDADSEALLPARPGGRRCARRALERAVAGAYRKAGHGARSAPHAERSKPAGGLVPGAPECQCRRHRLLPRAVRRRDAGRQHARLRHPRGRRPHRAAR